MEALRNELDQLRATAAVDGGLIRAALEQSPHPIVIYDPQGRITWRNRAAQKLSSESADDPLKERERDREPSEPEEVHFERLDGSHGVLLAGSAPIFDPSGGFQGAVSVFTDVTRLKQVEELLLARERSAQERAHRLEAVTAALLQALTPGQVAAVAVEQGRAALGAPEGGLWLLAHDEPVLALAHASGPWVRPPRPACISLRESPSHPLAEAMRSGAPVFVDWSGPLGPGCPGPVEAAAANPGRAVTYLPLLSQVGCLGVLAFGLEGSRSYGEGDRAFLRVLAPHCGQALDRAHLYQAERTARAEAEAEHARAAFLMEASVLLSSSLDCEATLASLARLAVPRIADACAVYLAEDVLARGPPLAMAHLDPEKAALAADLARRYPFDPAATTGPAQVVRSGRSELYPEIPDELLVSAAQDQEHLRILRQLGFRSAMVVPMPARGGTLGALVLASAASRRSYGPTDLGMAEELARRAGQAVDNARLYQEAQRAVQSRNEVLAIVSHDLKNPLSAVLMSSVLLERSPGGAEGIQRHARMVRRSAERMNRLIHHLLDLSSIEAGHFRLECRPQVMSGLLAEALALFQPVAASKAIDLETRVNGPLEAFCDRDRVFQVLSNLVGNALAFTPPGGRVSVSAEPAGAEIRIAISDTGPGIPEADRPHIFDRYWKSQRSHGGVGLGLAIAKGIVEAHGGRIWFEPAAGGGSTFAFTLPSAG